MVITDESWYVVRNTKGVTGFVGPGSKPVPLSEEEVEAMGIDTAVPKLVSGDNKFEIGEMIKVANGPFEGQVGTVEEINLESKEVKVCIDAFGKKTLFVIGFEGIEKYN
jgi:transcriptional antiterminator NusG